MLTLSLILVKSLLPVVAVEVSTPDLLRHPVHTFTHLNNVTDTWETGFGYVVKEQADLHDFMVFAGKTNVNRRTENGTYERSYNPQFDVYGPYNYFPAHCYKTVTGKYASPVIAYIKTGSAIEEDMLEQLEELFKAQQGVPKLVPQVSKLMKTFGQETDDSSNSGDFFKLGGIDPDPKFDQLTGGMVDQMDMSGIIDVLGGFELREFRNQQELDDYIQHSEYGINEEEHPGVCFGFSVTENEDQTKYELDLQFNDLWPDMYIGIPSQRVRQQPQYAKMPIPGYNDFSFAGFVYMQNWVANTILRRTTNKPDASIVAITAPVKFPSFEVDRFVLFMDICLSYFVLTLYIPLLYSTAHKLVQEKETGQKNYLKMAGVTNVSYWASWWIFFTLKNIVISTVSTIILSLGVFKLHSGLMIWLMLFFFGQSLFGLALIAQHFLKTSLFAGIATTVVYFGVAILEELVNEVDSPQVAKILMSLISPPVALINSFKGFVQYESSGIGIDFSNYTRLEYKQYTCSCGLWSLFAAAIISFVIGSSLEYFRVESKFARKKENTTKQVQTRNQILENSKDFQEVKEEAGKKFLQITGLKKSYGNGCQAVQGVSLKVYQDQIFCLVGQNGAGKTSIVQMLSGLSGASEGNASAFGEDLLKDTAGVRTLMGVCPQQDILFDLLTPQEHLEIFQSLKGTEIKQRKEEVEKLMKAVGIEEQRNTKTYTLSKSDKRKLAISIALIGDPKLVLLDEPTSGLDLSARLQLWTMLKEYKKDRIVLLTTHSIDEAQHIGDRIGIMKQGRITSRGSMRFVKKRFGVGYRISVKSQPERANANLDAFFAEQLGSNQARPQQPPIETVYHVYKQDLKGFIATLEAKKTELKIISYDVATLMPELSQIDPKEPRAETLNVVSQYTEEGRIDTDRSLISKADDKEFQEVLMKEAGPDEQPLEQKAGFNDEIDQEIQSATPVKVITKSLKEDSTKAPVQGNLNYEQKAYKKPGCCSLVTRIFSFHAHSDFRSRNRYFVQMGLPCLFLLFAFIVGRCKYTYRSESRIIAFDSTGEYKQRILINDMSVDPTSDVTIAELVGNLPNSEDSFDVTYMSKPEEGEFEFDQLEQDIYEFGHSVGEEPYHQGSFFVYEANREEQKYKFTAHVNMTSQDSVARFPQMMYESILKTATQNPDFEFKVRNTPFPPSAQNLSWLHTSEQLSLETVQKTLLTVLSAQNVWLLSVYYFLSVTYCMFLTSIVGQQVRARHERRTQTLNGFNMFAYWANTFIMDCIKFWVLIIVTVIIFAFFEPQFKSSLLIYALCPFSILPFTYVFSLMFEKDTTAQYLSFVGSFLTITLIGTVSNSLKLSAEIEKESDMLGKSLKYFVPIYSLNSSLYADKSAETLQKFRERTTGTGENLTGDFLSIEYIYGDLLAILFQFVFWISVLFIVENIKNGKFGKRLRTKPRDILFNNTDLTYKRGCCSKEVGVLHVETKYLEISHNDKVAFIGGNGCGKSTLFDLLTSRLSRMDQPVAYCSSEVDSVLAREMSTQENVCHFSLLNCKNPKEALELMARTIKAYSLEKIVDKKVAELSKVEAWMVGVACLLLGDPKVVIVLDELVAGLDSEGRRLLFENLKQTDCAVLVATTDLDHLEALRVTKCYRFEEDTGKLKQVQI